MNALTLFYFHGGGAGVDAPGFEIAGGYGCEAEHCAFADVDSGSDAGSGTDPGVGAHLHGVGEEGESGIVEVVGGSAKVGVLREDGVRADADGGGVVDFSAVGNSDEVCADEVPGSPHTRGWIELAGWAEPRTEKAKEQSSPGKKWTRRKPEENSPRNVPEQTLHSIAKREGRAEVRIFGAGGGDVLRRVVVDLAGHLRLSLSALDFDGSLETDVARGGADLDLEGPGIKGPLLCCGVPILEGRIVQSEFNSFRIAGL